MALPHEELQNPLAIRVAHVYKRYRLGEYGRAHLAARPANMVG